LQHPLYGAGAGLAHNFCPLSHGHKHQEENSQHVYANIARTEYLAQMAAAPSLADGSADGFSPPFRPTQYASQHQHGYLPAHHPLAARRQARKKDGGLFQKGRMNMRQGGNCLSFCNLLLKPLKVVE